MRNTRLLVALSALPAMFVLVLASCAQPEPARPPSRVNVTAPAAQNPSPKAQSSTQPAAQTTPPVKPAIQPAVQPSVAPPAASNAPASADGETKWWLLTPEPVEGQLRVIASGSAPKLIDAREHAVKNARDLLARSLGHEPEDSTIERTAAEESGGVYTAWVLISTPNSP